MLVTSRHETAESKPKSTTVADAGILSRIFLSEIQRISPVTVIRLFNTGQVSAVAALPQFSPRRL